MVQGYQEDISDGQWGSFYHEQGKELPWTPSTTCSDGALTDWRTLEIIADGPKVTHIVNGKTCFGYGAFKVLDKGIIALQLHTPGDFTVEFRNVFIQPINNSFQIPANKAYDKNGKPISVFGTRIVPNARFANGFGNGLEKGLSTLAFDAQGRMISGNDQRPRADQRFINLQYRGARLLLSSTPALP